MELLAVKLEKKQNGIIEVHAEKKILGSENSIRVAEQRDIKISVGIVTAKQRGDFCK